MKPSEKMYRTLLRGVRITDTTYYVNIPAWDSHYDCIIPIPLTNVPAEIIELYITGMNIRCHAKVNIGADDIKDLKITDWEIEHNA